jgi:hypothetical protein
VRGEPLAESLLVRPRRNVRDAALAALFFLIATIIFTWPIAPRAATGLADLWDAKLNAWILHWDFHQIFRDPLHLFDANIFFPSRYSLAFSENLFGAALFGFPLYAMGLSTLAVYNVVFLLGMFLSAMAAWALARDVTGDSVASAVAGLVYAFSPWRIAQIPHVQYQWGAFLALALLFLLRYLDGGRRRDAGLFAVCFAWNALCNLHYAIFSGLLFAVVLVYEGLAAGWVVIRSRLPGALAALGIAGIVVLPFLIPYALASRLYGMQRGFGEIDFYSGTWTSFLSSGGQNKIYGAVTRRWDKAEGELFPGVVASGLAAVALASRRRVVRKPDSRQATPARHRMIRILDVWIAVATLVLVVALLGRTRIGPLELHDRGRIVVFLTAFVILRLGIAFPRWSRFDDLGDLLRQFRPGTRAGLFAAVALLGVLVALGMHTPYYRFGVQSLGPLLRIIRVPARGVVLFDLALGVLAALGLSEIRRRWQFTRVGIAAAAVLAIGLEYRAFPVNVHPVDPRAASVRRWLADLSFAGGLIELPLGAEYDQEYEFRSTEHWKPLVNGSSGFSPPGYEELAHAFDQRPVSDVIWKMLAERRVTLLVLHKELLQGDSAAGYIDTVRRGIRQRRLVDARSFHDGDHRDLVLRLSTGSAVLGTAVADPAVTNQELESLDLLAHPPFGYIDAPAEGETIAAGAWAYGWALDDSGVARVTVSIDDGQPQLATFGQPHPGPPRLYPEYPDSTRAGFGVSIPLLASGPHTLSVTILAKDGGQTRMQRSFLLR